MSPDCAALAALHADAFAGSGPRPWSAAEIAALLASPGCFATVDPAAPPQGFALARVAADEAELLTLAVARAARRRGLGAALLDAAMAAARRRGAARMVLEVGAANRAARDLYRRAGFVDVGARRGYHAPGDAGNALIMNAFL